MRTTSLITGLAAFLIAAVLLPTGARAQNPIITDVFTADPAAIVHDGTVYLYVGHDEAPPNSHYRLNRWLCYSSTDMQNWTPHGSPLAVSDFSWATRDAYAAHTTEKDGKFYWYVSIEHDRTKPGKAIGVAVSDSPTGPFEDARGSALITADMTSRGGHGWEDIDPAVFTDEDGTSYLFWGNRYCYYAKLKPNMIELDGPVTPVDIPWFTEAPWIHKHGDLYYLTYATGFPEKIAYATATSITGPWTYRGLLAEGAGNSNTIHQAIIEFNDQWYFFYHTGMLPGGDSYRRSVCIDYLYHNPDGTLRRVVQTTEGTSLPPTDDGTVRTPPLPTWNRLQSFEDPDLFVRHANHRGVLSPYPTVPYEDAMWNAVPGLADDSGVSFESLNFPGHFLRRDGADVVLAENDGTAAFEEEATFVREPGLADPEWSSFRAAGAPDLYLRRAGDALRVGSVSTQAESEAATFRLTEEGGRAGLPPVPAAATDERR